MPDDETTKPLNVRIPNHLHARLTRLADDRMVGQGKIVIRAVEEYLDKLEKIDPLAPVTAGAAKQD